MVPKDRRFQPVRAGYTNNEDRRRGGGGGGGTTGTLTTCGKGIAPPEDTKKAIKGHDPDLFFSDATKPPNGRNRLMWAGNGRNKERGTERHGHNTDTHRTQSSRMAWVGERRQIPDGIHAVATKTSRKVDIRMMNVTVTPSRVAKGTVGPNMAPPPPDTPRTAVAPGTKVTGVIYTSWAWGGALDKGAHPCDRGGDVHTLWAELVTAWNRVHPLHPVGKGNTRTWGRLFVNLLLVTADDPAKDIRHTGTANDPDDPAKVIFSWNPDDEGYMGTFTPDVIDRHIDQADLMFTGWPTYDINCGVCPPCCERLGIDLSPDDDTPDTPDTTDDDTTDTTDPIEAALTG